MVQLSHLNTFIGILAIIGRAHAGVVHTGSGSPGCGKSQKFIGQSKDFTIQSSGGRRTYRVHLPSNYKINQPQPLLLGYHGNGEVPSDFESYTQFSDDSINSNMIAVYPAGVGKHWEGPSYATPGVSDLVFTTDLINQLKNDYCVDTSRIYATGRSNGGGFVNTLACSHDHGSDFAAFAAFAGAMYTDVTGNGGCHPSVPRPLFEIHGTGDNTIPYDGGSGKGGPVPAIPEWLSRWASRDGCTSNTTTQLPNNVQDINWTCQGIKGMLRHLRLDDHSHKYAGQNDRQIFVSPIILSWLSRFTSN